MVFGMGGGGDNSLEIAVESAGVDSFQSNIGNAEDALGNLRNTALGAGTALMGLGAAGMAGISKVTGQAMDLESSFAEVSTLMGENEDAAEQYGDTVQELSEEFAAQGGQTEVVNGLYQTLSAGIADAGDETEFLEESMRAATAGLADTEQAVDILSTIINGYGKEADEASEVSDKLFETVRQGKTTFPELAQNLGDVIPTAAEMEVGLGEVNAAVATLTANGQSTAKATTALNRAFIELMDPGEDLQETIEGLGYESGRALVEAEGFSGALEMLSGETENSDKSMDDLFQNTRALRAVLPLAGEASDSFRENLDAMENSSGAADEAFEEMSDTSEFQLRQAMNRLKNITSELGDAMLGELTPAITFVADQIGILADWFNGLDEETQGLIARIAIFASTFSLLTGALLVGSAVAPVVAGAIGSIVAPVLAVTAAAAVLFAAWESNLFGIQDITEDAVEGLRETFNAFLGWLTEWWDRSGRDMYQSWVERFQLLYERLIEFFGILREEVFAPALNAILGLWERHGESVINFFEAWYEWAVGFWTGLFSFLREDVFGPALDRLLELWRVHGEEVFGEIKATADAILGYWEWWLTGIYENIVEPILGLIADVWESHGETIMAFVEWWTGQVRANFEFLFDAVIGIATTALDGLLTLFRTIMALIRKDWEQAWDLVAGFAERTLDGLVDFASEWGGRLIDGLVESVTSAGSRLADAFRSLGESAIEAFREKFNDLVPGSLSIPEVTIPNPTPGADDWSVGGGSFDVPQLASGGVVTDPTMAVVGEGGEDEAVLPLSKLRGMLESVRSGGPAQSDAGGGDVRIENIEVNANDRREGREAGKAFAKELRSAGFRL